MRLVMWSSDSGPRPGVVVDDFVLDGSPSFGDASRFAGEAFRRMDELRGLSEEALQAILKGQRPDGVVGALSDVRLLAPVVSPSKILCVGLNYSGHVKEIGVPTPVRPHTFSKLPSALAHPDSVIEVPWNVTSQVDWEAELAVIIGRGGRDITEAEAADYILGYTIANDVSARDWQFASDDQLTLGKGFDTFFPLGPWIVPRDEIDPHSLHVRSLVDGEVRQEASTAEMIFGVERILSFLSTIATLEPGDVIATGTPAGVGYGREPQVFLERGQSVVVEIDGIGALRNQVGSRGD